MNPKWRLRHTSGFLQLGMLAEAEAELARLTPEEADSLAALPLRVALLQEQGNWPALRDVATKLVARQPTEAAWWITLAYATRRCESLAAANVVLTTAANLHPANATIRFNLACYACQLGELPTARAHLSEAIRLDAAFESLARTDDDLAPLRTTRE